MKLSLLFCLPLFLLGCSSFTPSNTNTTRSQQCLRMQEPMRSYSVTSPNELVIQYTGKTYRVTLDPTCNLQNPDRIGFSNGPEQMVTQGYQTIYAGRNDGNGQICGRAFDTLIWRKTGEDFSRPGRTCRVQRVEIL